MNRRGEYDDVLDLLDQIVVACDGNGFLLLIVWLRFRGYNSSQVGKLLGLSNSSIDQRLRRLRVRVAKQESEIT